MIELPSVQERKAKFEDHFGFRETPFGVTPDPRFFYSHPIYVQALAALVYGIQDKKGLMLVTGEVGMGKTILLRMLMRQLGAAVQFVFLSIPRLSSCSLIEVMVQKLGLTHAAKNKLEMIHALNSYLLQQMSSGHTVALLIDEAQQLGDEALESVCDLSNLETDEEKLLQIVLAGQPELATHLCQPSLREIKQRVAMHHRLFAMHTVDEVADYIRHRLGVVDCHGVEIFSKEAMQAVWYYSVGTPRLIHSICDNALAMASETGKQHIGPYIIKKVAESLMLERATEYSKTQGADLRVFRAQEPPIGNNHNGSRTGKLNPDTRHETPNVGTHDPAAISRTDAKEPTVPPQFFGRMSRAAAAAIGPMAHVIVRDQISALGESRDAFPQKKLGELIQSVSREISNESMKASFQEAMVREMTALKTLWAIK
jgi:general secretion pathway protein A